MRSEASLSSYGTNVDLLLRPDSAIFVVHTSLGFLITYSLATDADSRVYKPHFTSHTNVQRRRQNHFGDPGYAHPDQIMWGPGEGGGVRDVSVRFKVVIKVDAGIESALALDDELVVATRKPAAIQCIRWVADESGNQTSTELLNRMAWAEKKVTIKEMTHDRPMNLWTWITSDGRAYAVQRCTRGQPGADAPESDPKKLFQGYCFHIPQGEHDFAKRAVINARFSLIAIGCADGSILVYSAKDYVGNIPSSHTHKLPVSKSGAGALQTLTYSPDGYCLFAGYEKGWATWSVYGKPLSNSFNADPSIAQGNGEEWISGIREATWIGGACEILLLANQHQAVWLLELARNAVTGCYSAANLFRTVLQTNASVMVYRGYDLPDLTTISAEPFLWHTARVPSTYLLNQWPIRYTVISADGRYVAVAGRRGLAHYSISSGRWKTFANEAVENEFQVRGGMCWYQNILVAAVEVNKMYELRLYSREAVLDSTNVLHTQQMPAAVVLITPSGEDSLLVYTYNNILHHFIFAPVSGSIRLVQVGHIAFHGIVRSPARVRGLSWVLPESQLVDGDPSQDVVVASVLFLVDGKLVLLKPAVNDEGHQKYDMRVIAQNVEYYACTRDQPFARPLTGVPSQEQDETLHNSLWIFDGSDLKAWTSLDQLLQTPSGVDLPPAVSVPADFYPLSILLNKGIILGVEPDLVQRRDVNFSFFRFSIRVSLAKAPFPRTAPFPLTTRVLTPNRRTSSSPKSSASTSPPIARRPPWLWRASTRAWPTSRTPSRSSSTTSWTRRWTARRRRKRHCSHACCPSFHRSRPTSTSWCSARARPRCGRGARCSPTCRRRRSCSRSRSSAAGSRRPAATCWCCTRSTSSPPPRSRACACSPAPPATPTGSCAASWPASWPPWTPAATRCARPWTWPTCGGSPRRAPRGPRRAAAPWRGRWPCRGATEARARAPAGVPAAAGPSRRCIPGARTATLAPGRRVRAERPRKGGPRRWALLLGDGGRKKSRVWR